MGSSSERFNAIDKVTNRGVHADVGVPEAELSAIHRVRNATRTVFLAFGLAVFRGGQRSRNVMANASSTGSVRREALVFEWR